MYPLNLLDFTPLFDIFKNNIVYFTVCTNHMLSHHFLPKFNEKTNGGHFCLNIGSIGNKIWKIKVVNFVTWSKFR